MLISFGSYLFFFKKKNEKYILIKKNVYICSR